MGNPLKLRIKWIIKGKAKFRAMRSVLSADISENVGTCDASPALDGFSTAAFVIPCETTRAVKGFRQILPIA
jgi:hypothetical protein